jgi:predicted transcriptional regulator
MAGDSWTFLSNHGHVLVFLSAQPDARIRDVAASVGITERATQGIISDLEREGYVKVMRVGRRNHYRVNRKARFRHPAEDHHSISGLLEIFAD